MVFLSRREMAGLFYALDTGEGVIEVAGANLDFGEMNAYLWIVVD
jgi:hypothetical protein